MSLWELAACMDGWNRSQGVGHRHIGDPFTDEEYDALVALGESWNG